MPHNIEERNGVYSFVENEKNNERAWHGLGQTFDGAIPLQDALKLSGCDFTCESQNVYLKNGIIIPNTKAIVRTDTQEVLACGLTDRYTIVQNRVAFGYLDAICSQGSDQAVIETAGVLGKGETCFVTAKFADVRKYSKNDESEVKLYVVFTNSHNGKYGVSLCVTPVRVVCNNTLNWALGSAVGMKKMKHTPQIKKILSPENIDAMIEELGIRKYFNYIVDDMEFLAKQKLTDKEARKLLAEEYFIANLVAPIEKDKKAEFKSNIEDFRKSGYSDNQVSSIFPTRTANSWLDMSEKILFGQAYGQDFKEQGTKVFFLNGLTSYADHDKRFSNQDNKFKSIIMDDGFEKKKIANVVAKLKLV